MNEVTIGNMPTLPYAVEEAVNRLRINISFLGSDIKKIMVISTMPDEGKSFVTMQLWRQMAESGTPSILLDADLRKSVMTDKYDITMNDGSEVWGTSYILAHDIPIQDAVLHTQISGGDILPNVKNVVNPSMLMESKQFENMLNTMADMYRYVFIDAPPLNLVSDGEKIGSLCDGAILVVRGGLHRRKWCATPFDSWKEQAVRYLVSYLTVPVVTEEAITTRSMAARNTVMDMVTAIMAVTARVMNIITPPSNYGLSALVLLTPQ